MTVSNRRRGNVVSLRLVALTAALLAPAAVLAGSARASSLPNPCTVLRSANAGKTIGGSASATGTPGPLKTYGTGKYQSLSCSEKVGKVSVYLTLSGPFNGGFGGVVVTSQSHPAGFGGTATLIVGIGSGTHAPVDFIDFHHGSVYADVNANGAEPAALTELAQSVYKLIP